MKNSLLAVIIFLLCARWSIAAEVGIGSKSQATVSIPDSFHHENEDETTIFLAPRENDPNGPIAMEMTSLRDLAPERLSVEQVQELLDRVNPKSKRLHFGANLATTQTEESKDDKGNRWHCVHYALYADGLLVTVTVQTAQGREKEPQCKELLDQAPQILGSIKRKKG